MFSERAAGFSKVSAQSSRSLLWPRHSGAPEARTLERNGAPGKLEIPGLVLAHHPGMTKYVVIRQNQRSPTNTVSPGARGVPSGTTARMEPPFSVCVTVTTSRLARGEKPPAMATALSTVMFGT